MIKKIIDWFKHLLFGSFFSTEKRPDIKRGKTLKTTEEIKQLDTEAKLIFHCKVLRRRRKKLFAMKTVKNQIDRRIYKHAST